MSALIRTFDPDTSKPRAIALRCRKASGAVAFDQVYLGVPFYKTHSGHVETFEVYIPGMEGDRRTLPLSANLFYPVNPDHWHMFTRVPTGSVEKAVDEDGRAKLARLRSVADLMTGSVLLARKRAGVQP